MRIIFTLVTQLLGVATHRGIVRSAVDVGKKEYVVGDIRFGSTT